MYFFVPFVIMLTCMGIYAVRKNLKYVEEHEKLKQKKQAEKLKKQEAENVQAGQNTQAAEPSTGSKGPGAPRAFSTASDLRLKAPLRPATCLRPFISSAAVCPFSVASLTSLSYPSGAGSLLALSPRGLSPTSSPSSGGEVIASPFVQGSTQSHCKPKLLEPLRSFSSQVVPLVAAEESVQSLQFFRRRPNVMSSSSFLRNNQFWSSRRAFDMLRRVPK
eukprot:gb/GEZN01018220.1/.p1 GENE.gb/GEZN01018220.1/~~gb/GEZN01018220.1/.p1  ORF type:complete len:219 (+),score=25.53 gb/GEZN01018220.1/:71-727(+)